MATFFNQATLSYNGTVTNSNLASGELLAGADLSKIALNEEYSTNGAVTYAVSYTNTTGVPISNATLTDDLGAFTLGAITVYPLEYSAGSLKYYVNGVLQPTPTVTAGPPLVISGITVPAGGNILVVYEANTNEFTPRAQGSTLTNTVTAPQGVGDPLTASSTVTVADEVNLSISKSICPNTVTDGATVTYTFVIQNMGNTPAVATDNIIVSDTFDPILTGITVTLDGNALTLGDDYTYDEATGAFATVQSVITVPAATYTTDSATGVITTTPGVAVLTVTGTI